MIEHNKLKEQIYSNREAVSINQNILLLESKERLELALEALVNGGVKCAVYYAYTSMVMNAKAFLWSRSIYKHTHLGVVNGFNTYFLETNDAVNKNVFNNNFQFDLEQTISIPIAQYYVSKALEFNIHIKTLKH